MSFNILKFPNKSHRKIIKIPAESSELAEFMGIVFGDGGIGNPWQLVISLNSMTDLRYSHYVSDLLIKLFDINVVIRKRPNQNTLVLICSSMNLIDFLVRKGAVRGNKIRQGIDMPLWIGKRAEYKKAFVRGLVDTDGCLFIHKHTTKGVLCNNIGFCFTSGSGKLIISVAKILKEFGITPYITDHKRRIYLYSFKSVLNYLSVFGSSNQRILGKYRDWLHIKKQ